MSFAIFGLPTPILKGIRASGFSEPTAIQSKAIPIILQGNDLIGAAQSGSGKTGAYALPLLARLIDSAGRLRAIILVPTRELAQYVETRARDYARYTDVKIDVVFTGAPLQQQEKALREQEPDLLVATPGRLLELHARGCLNFENVELLVLDEADRMVTLGLAPDVRKLLKLLPETRQTMMFSMTMPPELNRLAKEALIEPVRVDLAPASRPVAGITQAIYPVSKELKADLLDEMFSRMEVRSTVICTRARYGAERLLRHLTKHGYAVRLLDDHQSQGEREQAIEDLRRGRIQILLASDAAVRSIDVTGVSHVVNHDVPQTPEDYVHRLGRTGRPEAVGDVFTLMSPEEQRDVAAIERFLGRAIPRVILPDFDYGKAAPMRVLGYEEDGGRLPDRARRPAQGLGVVAARIAGAPRPTASVVRPATSGPRSGSLATPSSPPTAASRTAVATARPAASPSQRPVATARGANSSSRPAAHKTATAARKRPARSHLRSKPAARNGNSRPKPVKARKK